VPKVQLFELRSECMRPLEPLTQSNAVQAFGSVVIGRYNINVLCYPCLSGHHVEVSHCLHLQFSWVYPLAGHIISSNFWNENYKCYVRFEVFTAVTMKKAVFWDVAPCRYGVNRRFEGTYRLHLQGRREI
jgi:hypothetical protein